MRDVRLRLDTRLSEMKLEIKLGLAYAIKVMGLLLRV